MTGVMRGIILAAFAGMTAAPAVSDSLTASGEAAPIRGVVRAVDRATIATSESLRALEVKVRVGDRFKRGDVLVRFDCSRQGAERGAAESAKREAYLNWETARKLSRYNAIGKIEVDIAKQRLNRASYELEAIQARLKDCELVAPFDGRVADVSVRPLEQTQAHQPYISIVSSGDLEIEAIVNAHSLTILRPGAPFRFAVDELGGLEIAAVVSAIGASVDPVSKTIKIIGTISGGHAALLPGMSGTISIDHGG